MPLWKSCVSNVSNPSSSVNEHYRSKYRLLGLVGQGQFGRVYCAVHRRTGSLVALKELDRSRFSTHKFLRELRFLLSLQHENIVTCRALEHTATGRYLVMDYCEGGTLRSLLDEEVFLHPVHGIQLILQILAGLDHAHQRGIVHCDIKPENILLTLTADGWRARITDFGIAQLSQDMAREGFSNTGSPAYMAPERFYGQYSPASDTYAVGILLFEMLVGDRPFSGIPGELMSAHLNQSLKLPDKVPPSLRPVLTKALQKLPARRFKSAQEMESALRQARDTAMSELNAGWEHSTLLRPRVALPKTPLQAASREPLQASLQQLASGNWRSLQEGDSLESSQEDLEKEDLEKTALYQVMGNRVGRQIYAEAAIARSPADSKSSVNEAMATVRLPEPVTSLLVRPQGCFAATQKAVYLLPPGLFEPGVKTQQKRFYWLPGQTTKNQAVPQLMAVFPEAMLAAINSAGQWMATATTDSAKDQSDLHVWNLRHHQPFLPTTQVAVLAGVSRPGQHFQLLSVDAGHFVAFSHRTDVHSMCIVGVRLDVFTRRGTAVGWLDLNMPLRHVSLTSTRYRLLATEPGRSGSVLFLDLKPLRIQRIGLEITPKFLASAPWGHVLMDEQGQIELINTYGQTIARIDGPSHPTALTLVDPYRLAIATWRANQGYLHLIDLRKLDLDVVF
jgi:serine/threonine protein kinase